MDELFLSRCQIAFTCNAIQIFAPSELVAIALRRSKKELAQWAVQFRKEATEIFFPGDGGRPYKILGSFAQTGGEKPPSPEVSNLVFGPGVGFDVQSLRILERMRESEKPMSLVNLETDSQDWVNQPLIEMLQRSAEFATQQNMKDYWEEDALVYVKSVLRQQGRFDHNYRAMLPYGLAHFTSTFEVVQFGFPESDYRLVTIHSYELLPVEDLTGAQW